MIRTFFRRVIITIVTVLLFTGLIRSGDLSEVQAATETSRYYHLDFRIDATVKITVLNEDGSTSTQTVTGTISNPQAVIYNTGSTTWSKHDWVNTDSETGISYFNVNFKSSTSSDQGVYEYMMADSTPGRQTAEFYNGDTVELNYTLTYTYNGQTYTLNLSETRVFAEEDNQCNSKNENGTKRGFDIVVSTEDITSAMSTSQLQISKFWDDNNAESTRPATITVKVYQTINSTESHYMTLTLAKDKSVSGYTMAEGITADEDMSITFADDYGVTITGLPQNYWIKNGSSYSYVSCSYSVKEVQAEGNAAFEALYGSFVYVDDTNKDSYIITITNTLAYEKLAVKKVWADSDSVDHSNDSVNVQLKAYYDANGIETIVPDAWLAEFIGTSTTVTLSNGNSWYSVWGNMPVYYTPDSDTAYRITRLEAVETSITTSTNETYTAIISGISAEKDEDGNYYFSVTNTPEPKTTSVTVSKTVTGNLGEYNKAFTFTALFTCEDGSIYVPSGYTANENGEFTFTLKHGETITFPDVPLNSTLVISENNTDEYIVSIDGNTDSDASITYTVSDMLEIKFVNNKNVTIATGIDTNSNSLITIVLIICLAFAITFASRFARHKYF